MTTFATISDVDAWARQHGGLQAVNQALASGEFGTDAQTIRTAIRYVEREELKIAQRKERESRRENAISAAEQAAREAQKSAREAYISRWIAIISAVLALASVLISVT